MESYRQKFYWENPAHLIILPLENILKDERKRPNEKATIYSMFTQSPPSSLSSISLSSTMLTCKTPPHAVHSKQPVRLMVDSVERLARVPFTYNQDPIISSIQPSRSFVRWGETSSLWGSHQNGGLLVFRSHVVFHLKQEEKHMVEFECFWTDSCFRKRVGGDK